MRLVLRRKGGLTVCSPNTGRVYRFREGSGGVQVEDAGDVGYILGVHGQSIEPARPLADGWAFYTGADPEKRIGLLTGSIVLHKDKPTRISLPQQLELEKRRHWKPATPMQTYQYGMRRLLVTRDAGMGDLLMLLAALRELRRQCPELETTLSTIGCWRSLLEGQPGVADVVTTGEEDELGPFDQSVNLVRYVEMADSRFRRHRVDVFGEPLGLDEVPDKRVSLRLERAEVSKASEEFNGVRRPFIGVALRGSTNVRSYPKDMVPNLCSELQGRGMSVGLIDHEPQPRLPLPDGTMRFCGTHDARGVAVLVSLMDCIVAPDSGLVHTAAAVGTPCVAIASGVPPELRWSAYENLVVVDAAKRIGCTYCHDGPHCRPAGVGSGSMTDWGPPCLRSLPPAEVASIVAEVVN